MKSGILRTLTNGLAGLFQGFGVTLIHLFRPPITEEYPEYKRPLPERSRARIILTRDPDGEERCVACYLCSAVCPVSCISMQSAEREDGRRIAPWFRINFSRCIYCGLCELVAEKEDLLVAHGGKNNEYNFYRYAGVVVAGDKGRHIKEAEPINLKSNLP
jgi:NADH-quinone oxidoreductase subunit I